jgi:hypothetical protein
VIEALSPDAAEEALADGVGPRRSDRRPDHRDPAGCGEAVERGAVLGVVVVDQEARPRPFGCCRPRLLRHPGVGRRAGDAEAHHAARAALDDQEGAHRPEEQVRELQDVARPDIGAVGAQEGRPTLTCGARRPNAPQVPLDGALADGDAELEQLAPDPLRSPEPSLARHPLDQGDHVRRDARLPGARGRPPPPDETEPGAVPAQQRRRLHDLQGLAPRPDAAGQEDEERPIGRRDARPPGRPARGSSRRTVRGSSDG